MVFADAIFSYLNYTDSTDNWATWSPPLPLSLPDAPPRFNVNHGTLIMPPGGLDLATRITKAGPDHVQIAFHGTPGDYYRLSTSTNLASWTHSDIIPPPSGNPITRTLPTSGNPRQFWRIERLLP
jgi:hypothetical protein